MFVPRVERPLESGDAPDAVRLKTISRRSFNLRMAVGIDNGVRIFVASRKQFLPDFLTSSRKAAGRHLEFNVLQAISDEDARVAFIRRVVNRCSDEQLIGRNDSWPRTRLTRPTTRPARWPGTSTAIR